MKKILTSIIILVSALFMLTSCGTVAVAAETGVVTDTGYIEYYDYGTGYIVVYIDGIANYRFWDDLHHRYWYRVVPHDRFSYIRYRDVRHHHKIRPHHDAHHRHPAPHRHPDARPSHPHRNPSGSHMQHQRRPSNHPSSTRMTPSRNGSSHMGGHHSGNHSGAHRR